MVVPSVRNKHGREHELDHYVIVTEKNGINICFLHFIFCSVVLHCLFISFLQVKYDCLRWACGFNCDKKKAYAVLHTQELYLKDYRLVRWIECHVNIAIE